MIAGLFGGATVEILGVNVGDVVKVGAEAGGLVKSLSESFKAIREGVSIGKGKGNAEVAAALAQADEKLAELKDRITQLQALCSVSHDLGRRLEKELTDAKVEKNAVEEKLAVFDTFDQTSAAYVEVALANHSVAVRQSAPLKGKISAAYFCPNCFGNRKHTVMSFKEHVLHADKLECGECRTAAYVPRDDGPSVIMTAVRSRYDPYS